MEKSKPEFGRVLAELRRSNAAGKHVKTAKDRRNKLREAIRYSKEAG
jgi:hypothetical protein